MLLYRFEYICQHLATYRPGLVLIGQTSHVQCDVQVELHISLRVQDREVDSSQSLNPQSSLFLDYHSGYDPVYSPATDNPPKACQYARTLPMTPVCPGLFYLEIWRTCYCHMKGKCDTRKHWLTCRYWISKCMSLNATSTSCSSEPCLLTSFLTDSCRGLLTRFSTWPPPMTRENRSGIPMWGATASKSDMMTLNSAICQTSRYPLHVCQWSLSDKWSMLDKCSLLDKWSMLDKWSL